MLDLQHADLARERRQRIFAQNGEEVLVPPTTKLASQIVKSSKKISLKIGMKRDLDALCSPRMTRPGTRQQQLSDLDSFIGRLSNPTEPHRGRESLNPEDLSVGGTSLRGRDAL